MQALIQFAIVLLLVPLSVSSSAGLLLVSYTNTPWSNRNNAGKGVAFVLPFDGSRGLTTEHPIRVDKLP